MALLAEMQNDITTPGKRLSDILRKAQILAARLGNPALTAWVASELGGYNQPNAQLPDYRKVPTVLLGDFVEPFRRTTNLQLPTSQFPADARDFFEYHTFHESIRELESLAEGSEPQLETVLPTRYHQLFSNRQSGVTCIKLYQPITRAQIDGVLDAVRTRLLGFVLELEKAYPEAGEKTATEVVLREQVGQIFTTNIYGSNNVIAAGHSVNQSVQQNVTAGDLNTIDDALGQLGVAANDIRALHEAINQDGPRTVDAGLGERVQAWIGRFSANVAMGAVKVTTELAPVIVAKLVAKYYGWG